MVLSSRGISGQHGQVVATGELEVSAGPGNDYVGWVALSNDCMKALTWGIAWISVHHSKAHAMSLSGWSKAEESQQEVPLNLNTSRTLALYPESRTLLWVSDLGASTPNPIVFGVQEVDFSLPELLEFDAAKSIREKKLC
ncbi:hypothetical protein Nepgr_031245 [Nepenthes gracilis]|uniref:Uncharacterized protein n=1 Tax=Nepenthes gracilis TaxID=150966 RepID=A0AAD3TIG6_NEPGR|nr:hypothetical protein Nepgr_031245 [Nepenthes gracilis]